MSGNNDNDEGYNGNPGSNSNNDLSDVTSPTPCTRNCPEENDCPEMDTELQSQLTDILGAGNFEINCNLTAEEMMNFDSIEEFEVFTETLADSFEFDESELINNQDGTYVTRFKGKLDMLFIPVYLNVHATSILDNIFTVNIDEFNLEEIESFESGITPFLDWKQDSYQYSLIGDIIHITIYGHFEIGASIGELELEYSDSFIITVSYNKTTGEAIDINLENDD